MYLKCNNEYVWFLYGQHVTPGVNYDFSRALPEHSKNQILEIMSLYCFDVIILVFSYFHFKVTHIINNRKLNRKHLSNTYCVQ